MLVPTYVCSETLNPRKYFIPLTLLLMISVPTLTVFSDSLIFISQLLFLSLSSLKFLKRFIWASSSFLLPCASHFHDFSILLTSNSIQFISTKCKKQQTLTEKLLSAWCWGWSWGVQRGRKHRCCSPGSCREGGGRTGLEAEYCRTAWAVTGLYMDERGS